MCESPDEEDEQPIETLCSPFLIRLPQLLHAPSQNQDELRRHLDRLQNECSFAKGRYRLISGLCKSGQLTTPELTAALIQFSGDYSLLLGIQLVLMACLSSMEPGNTSLQRLALDTARETIKLQKHLLAKLPAGTGFTPVALFASWIATDDPGIIVDIVSIMHKAGSYWANPSYMERAKTLKIRVGDIRSEASLRLEADTSYTLPISPEFSVPDDYNYNFGAAALGLFSSRSRGINPVNTHVYSLEY